MLKMIIGMLDVLEPLLQLYKEVTTMNLLTMNGQRVNRLMLAIIYPSKKILVISDI
jgi:hypothetical protein